MKHKEILSSRNGLLDSLIKIFPRESLLSCKEELYELFMVDNDITRRGIRCQGLLIDRGRSPTLYILHVLKK